ncbi:MAG: VWA domain-containing protein [Clostridia bacterium]|nr:VWA domain-containing protein [Clostridia bacterium]
MKNISFDNPYLLLILIPLLLLVIIPHVIAIRKTNRSAATAISLALHIAIVTLTTLALAGMQHTTVMTKTEVFIVADVSYSADKRLDTIDEYIKSIDDKLPKNSRYGVVAFGKDYTVSTRIGAQFTTVKGTKVDTSATDIASALNYTSTLFSDDVIKRIVLITDGKQTGSDSKEAETRLVQAIENLYAKNIYIDAVYLDSNLAEGEREVQISGVDFTPSTYLNHKTTADVLLRSSRDVTVKVTLFKGDSVVGDPHVVDLSEGFYIENFTLPTDEEGSFDYRIEVSPILSGDDYSTYNNSYEFHQEVTGSISVLLAATNKNDVIAAMNLYGENASLDIYLNDGDDYRRKTAESLFGSYPGFENATFHFNDTAIPCIVEDLCRYDEVMIVNTDVRDLQNYTAFIDAIDTVVSKFGKSLVTIGDTNIQNNTEEVLRQLEDMLPVKYGNDDREPKLYTLVIDVSLSMVQADHLNMARDSALALLELMSADDYVSVIIFSGDTVLAQPSAQVSSCRAAARSAIKAIEGTQGTAIGKALNYAYAHIKDQPFKDKQVILISDGLEGALEQTSAYSVAQKMKGAGITVSSMNMGTTDSEAVSRLQSIAVGGGGDYYLIESLETVNKTILDKVAEDMVDDVVEKKTMVNIEVDNDKVLDGVNVLPDINGYIYAKPKASANVILSVDFEREEGVYTQSALYATWNYGNGRVSSFSSTLWGDWMSEWEGDYYAELFLQNILAANTPEVKIDYPYTVNHDYDGIHSSLEVIPVILNPDATLTAEITLPDGTVTEQLLVFDSSKYTYSFETPTLGKYQMKLTYTYSEKTYVSTHIFNVNYPSEYDSFQSYSPSTIKKVMRDRGSVSEAGIPKLENNADEVGVYVITFIVPLMAAAVCLYVVDIIIRKLRWRDIAGLFKRSSYKGGKV